MAVWDLAYVLTTVPPDAHVRSLPPCAAGPKGGVVSRGTSHFFSPPHASPRPPAYTMGKKKQVRKFGEVKRLLNPKDTRLYVSCTHT